MPRFDTTYWPGLASSALASAKLLISDTASRFTSTNVDGALDEVGTSLNALDFTIPFANNIKGDRVATSQTTTSTSFTDLATVGPQVTCATKTSALVLISVNASIAVANFGLVGVAVSGATTVAATDTSAIRVTLTTGPVSYTHAVLLTGLTTGNNTFTLKYRVGGSTGTFLERAIVVLPLAV